MKILRLFINNDLNDIVNWVMVSEDDTISSGASSFAELAQFEEAQLEVYLNATCCSIFKTSVEGISTKRLTEELILGIIEESLTDEIENIKPIILRVEDDMAYIAIFNREFYAELINKISSLNKPIRFLQSFVYSTLYNENGWTLFLSNEQSFVRTSKYEYYLLDDNKPIPLLLQDMLNEQKPNSILVYMDNSYNIAAVQKLGVKCTLAQGDLEFGIPVWNFYNQKSTKFKLKLEPVTKSNLLLLLKSVKYLAIFTFAFWLLQVISLSINSYQLTAQLKNELKGIVAVDNLNTNLLQLASDKITQLRHQQGIYDAKDAIPLFNNFLDVVSNVNTNDITQINYTNGTLQIFLTNDFNTRQFPSYKNIFATKQIVADIEDYSTYAKANPPSLQANSNNLDNEQNQMQTSNNTAWVITLKTSLLHNKVRNS